MKKFIVTTSINTPTKVSETFSQKEGWQYVVAGDLQTPHEKYKQLDCIYLSPEEQEKQYSKLSNLIGWKCIQRRNFAILKAYELGADIIAIVDDDNDPLKNWGEDLLIEGEHEVKNYNISAPAFDPVGATSYKHLWHRGFPLELLPSRDYENTSTVKTKFHIQADFWNKDPDVDAICRMEHNPTCEFNNEDFPFTSNKLSPFNSQNTFITRDIVKDYFLFPHVGRMDDIWAAYYVTALGYKVAYNKPSVISDRNLGNEGRYSIINDMKKEYIGYENNLELVNDLNEDPSLIQKYLPGKSWVAFKEYQKIIS